MCVNYFQTDDSKNQPVVPATNSVATSKGREAAKFSGDTQAFVKDAITSLNMKSRPDSIGVAVDEDGRKKRVGVPGLSL